MRMRLIVISLSAAASMIAAVPAYGAVSEAEALTAAVARAGEHGLKSGTITVSSSGATSASNARAVFYSGEEAPGGTPLSSGPSYPFVLTNGSTFSPNEPHPPGDPIPAGKYLGLVINAATGGVSEVFTGPTAPPIARLGTVVTISISSGAAATASRSCRVDQLVVSALAGKHLHARLARAEHSLHVCKVRHA